VPLEREDILTRESPLRAIGLDLDAAADDRASDLC
jgi:hypothetical protein